MADQPLASLKIDTLDVQVSATRAELGHAAARSVAATIRELLERQPTVAMVFAAAPSQDDFLAALVQAEVPWDRIIALHLDEYLGLPETAPQRFGTYLRQHLFDHVRCRVVHFVDGSTHDPERECRRYGHLLDVNPLDISCVGIGENGHIAFNDPDVTDFHDRQAMRVVDLDQRSREQQVHDGCFASLDAVPHRALTMTIPAIMGAKVVSCVVPGPSKAEAVFHTLHGPIAPSCPASILRTHPHTTLYLDVLSAERVRGR